MYEHMTDEVLADEIGCLHSDIKIMTKNLADLKSEFKNRNLEEIIGLTWKAKIKDAVRWTLETAKIKAEMGESWYSERCKVSHVQSVMVESI